jgi:HD-like signal output (HDOD) protein
MRQFSAVMQSSKNTANEVDRPRLDEGGPELVEIRGQMFAEATGNLDRPSAPAIVQKLDEVLSSPDACAADIAEVVMMDVGLTVKLLSLVNSSVYALPREISSVEQAVALLGADQVRNVALAVSMISKFTETKSAAGFNPTVFWKHSLAVAVVSRLIGNVLRQRGNRDIDPGNLFLAGLMHDIGRVVVAQQLPEYYERIRSVAFQTNAPIDDVELAVLGTPHTAIGAQLLQEWNMAAEVCDGARYHHEPETKGTVPAIIHCGDAIAHGLGFGNSESSLPQANPLVWEGLALTNESIYAVGAKLVVQMEQFVETLLS